VAAPRESALEVSRDLALTEDSETLAYLQNTAWLFVPAANPDRILSRRTNKNGVDLNRDWLNLTQPETVAINALLSEYEPQIVINAHEGGTTFDEDFNANRSSRAYSHEALLELSKKLFIEVHDKMLSTDRTFDRWGTGRGGMMHHAAARDATTLILESWQNSSNSIQEPVPPSCELHLRAGDQSASFRCIIKHYQALSSTIKRIRVYMRMPR
jgi:hypothetical protein